MATNEGKQEIVWRFETPLRGELLSKILDGAITAGLTEKPTMSIVNASTGTVALSPCKMYVKPNNGADQLVKVLVKETVTKTIPKDAVYLVYRYAWSASSDSYGEFVSLKFTEEIKKEDILLSEFSWSGSSITKVNTDVAFTQQTNPLGNPLSVVPMNYGQKGTFPKFSVKVLKGTREFYSIDKRMDYLGYGEIKTKDFTSDVVIDFSNYSSATEEMLHEVLFKSSDETLVKSSRSTFSKPYREGDALATLDLPNTRSVDIPNIKFSEIKNYITPKNKLTEHSEFLDKLYKQVNLIEDRLEKSKKENFDFARPVGSYYTQYPVDRVASFSFASKSPSEMQWLGVWVLRFSTSGLFFRTEGGNAVPFQNTMQSDSVKNHIHQWIDNKGGTNDAGGGYYIKGDPTSNDNYRMRTWTHTQEKRMAYREGGAFELWTDDKLDYGSKAFTDYPYNYSGLGAGTETRPINKTFRVWQRIS